MYLYVIRTGGPNIGLLARGRFFAKSHCGATVKVLAIPVLEVGSTAIIGGFNSLDLAIGLKQHHVVGSDMAGVSGKLFVVDEVNRER